jgi:hypothetical protein
VPAQEHVEQRARKKQQDRDAQGDRIRPRPVVPRAQRPHFDRFEHGAATLVAAPEGQSNPVIVAVGYSGVVHGAAVAGHVHVDPRPFQEPLGRRSEIDKEVAEIIHAPEAELELLTAYASMERYDEPGVHVPGLDPGAPVRQGRVGVHPGETRCLGERQATARRGVGGHRWRRGYARQQPDRGGQHTEQYDDRATASKSVRASLHELP